MWLIYKITNMCNGKMYIGKTCLPTVEHRFKEHIQNSFKTYLCNRPLYDAIRKYGIENFIVEQIDIAMSDEEASIKEMEYIKLYNTYGGNSNGYNATIGGDGRAYVDRELVVAMHNDGMEVREIAEELGCYRDTVSAILRQYGINPRDNCTKRKSRPVYMCDKEEYDKVIKYFPSESEAARYLMENGFAGPKATIEGIVDKIGKVANGDPKRHTTCKHHWKWASDEEPMYTSFKSKTT